MSKKKIFLIFIFMSIFFFPLTKADVISINSGGDTGIIINPGGDIEGFFNGEVVACNSKTCAELGYSCGTWDDGCDGTINCGSCSAGNTCSSGACVPISPGVPPGGGGVSPLNITVSPTEINLKNMVVGVAEGVTITITNNEATTKTLSIGQSSLDKVVILGATTITLAPGETKNLDVTFVSLKPGNFAGTIFIDGIRVLVNLNVRTKKLLFDSNIVVLNKDYKVPVGNPLKTRVELIPMGDIERMDVTLNYAIKDYTGKIYLTKSETVLVDKKINFDRNFETGMLPLGDYIISLELVYEGGVAPSSAHFIVTKKGFENTFAYLIFFLLAAIIIISIFIIILLLRRRRKKEESQ